MKLTTNMKILVADDCLDTRNHIKLVLRKKGFKKIVSAADGEEAFQIMEQSLKDKDPVALVLADWQMPKVDGLQLLAQVKKDPKYRNVVFIMITSDNDREHVMQVLQQGVNNYIVKPVIGETLLEKVFETCKRA